MDTDSHASLHKTIMQANAICVDRGKKRLVSDVSMQVSQREIVGLIGPNGAGKSTLLATLAGLNKADRGEVTLLGKPLRDYSSDDRARCIGWMEQFAASHWPVSVEHLVALGRLPYLSRWQQLSDEDQTLIDEALTMTDCQTLRKQSVTTLSGGELTRVMLARVFATGPTLILADEPVAALDIGHQLQTMQQLSGFVSDDRACIVVLHDLSLAARFCDRLYLMDQSRIVANGTPEEVLSQENLRAVYGVEVDTGGGEHPYVIPTRISKA